MHLCISIPNNYPYQTLSKYKSIKNISTCVRKSTELMFKFSTIGINDFEKKLFLYSGKTPNDLGDYNKCLNEESTTFFLAKINFKTINFYFGICYFQECDVEAINSLLPKIFNFLELLNIKVKQYESNSVKITDTVEEELKNNEDFQFTFVIAMLFIFFISGFSCSIRGNSQ